MLCNSVTIYGHANKTCCCCYLNEDLGDCLLPVYLSGPNPARSISHQTNNKYLRDCVYVTQLVIYSHVCFQ